VRAVGCRDDDQVELGRASPQTLRDVDDDSGMIAFRLAAALGVAGSDDREPQARRYRDQRRVERGPGEAVPDQAYAELARRLARCGVSFS